jgi:hypothetical protein
VLVVVHVRSAVGAEEAVDGLAGLAVVDIFAELVAAFRDGEGGSGDDLVEGEGGAGEIL